MWSTREEGIKALNSTLQEEANLIYEGFELIDEIIPLFHKGTNLHDPNLFVGSLVLLKGRNLCQGILSLSLDGLAQEAGALLRPTIECFELLKYLYEEPNRIDKAINGRLPNAGKIASFINGNFKELRGYLNAHASHFSLFQDSLNHLIDWSNGGLKIQQRFSESALKKNLSVLYCIIVILSYEAANYLDNYGHLPDYTIDRLDKWRNKGLNTVSSALGKP